MTTELPSTLWREPEEIQIPPDILSAVGGEHFIAEALIRRGFTRPEQIAAFLDPEKYSPAPPDDLPDLPRAASRILDALRAGQHIGVWGDFDVDGQTATALLVSGLRRLGGSVSYHIPVRATESHGVNLPRLKKFLASGIDLLLTCDTGISAVEAVDYAQAHGVDTIITDHHTLPAALPKAFAILNPHFLPASHPLASLCGVGCAYKLMEALDDLAGQSTATRDGDLVALGTVADLALLVGDNRFLVQQGLSQMRSMPRLALRTLMARAEINSASLTEEHIAFALAPRLNALGRLDDATPVIEFLLSEDEAEVNLTASRLEAMNARRKMLADQIFGAAQSLIEKDHQLLDQPVLILHHPDWYGGVMGIVASRLVNLYLRPVVLITGKEGENARGSARSVTGVDITTAIAACQELLTGFGGHAMAAGFSLPYENLPRFRRALTAAVEKSLLVQPPKTELVIDSLLPLENITMELVEKLERLAPFGPGNPHLVFMARNLMLQSNTPIGKNQEHSLLVVEDEHGNTQKVVWWQSSGLATPEGRFDLAYSLRASNYRGQREIQAEWLGFRPIPTPDIDIHKRQKIKVIDLRQEVDPLSRLPSSQDILIWQEGTALTTTGKKRHQLHPAGELAILSIPPGIQELHSVLQTVQPKTVYLCAASPANDHPSGFLKKLGGLIRQAIQMKYNQVTLTELAAATAQREATVRLGLSWWVAHGDITVEEKADGIFEIRQTGNKDPDSLQRTETELKRLLQETDAFRQYYLRADPIHLISP